jgi:exo-beta-1,3-glucanase (GH17 family)
VLSQRDRLQKTYFPLGAAQLLADIQDARSMLSSLNLSIPVGNSDAGSFFNTQVLQAVDYGVSDALHPRDLFNQ